MDPNSAKNWRTNGADYTPGEWNDLIAEPGIVSNILITNTDSEERTIALRLADTDDNALAPILPTNTLAVGEAFVLDIKAVVVMEGQKVQYYPDDMGVGILASGAVEEAEEA